MTTLMTATMTTTMTTLDDHVDVDDCDDDDDGLFVSHKLRIHDAVSENSSRFDICVVVVVVVRARRS